MSGHTQQDQVYLRGHSLNVVTLFYGGIDEDDLITTQEWHLVSRTESINVGGERDWQISYISIQGKDQITMMHDGNGSILGFQFNLTVDSDSGQPVLSLLNLHREAYGYGDETMKFLQSLSSAIANREGCRVDLIFPTFGQEDTRKWLKKSGFDQFEVEGFGECYSASILPSSEQNIAKLRQRVD